MKKLSSIFMVLLVMLLWTTAYAIDFKTSGEYFIGGLYLDSIKVADKTTKIDSGTGLETEVTEPNTSTAFFYQRLRMKNEFVVSPSLKLVSRIDAMERVWGTSRTTDTAIASDSSESVYENENIAVDWLYIDYALPIGSLMVGYMNSGGAGLLFGNSFKPAPRISYSINYKDLFFTAKYTKAKEQSYSVNTPNNFADGDNDGLYLEGNYALKNGKVGLGVTYNHQADQRPAKHYVKDFYVFTPFASFVFGGLNLQAEFNYATGYAKKFDSGIGNVKLENYSAFVEAVYTLNPVYAGITLAYVSGDNPNSADKLEGGQINGGLDWNPCLLLFSYYDVGRWVGDVKGWDDSKVSGPMTNALFGQAKIGIKPTTKSDISVSVSHAVADEKPAGYVNDKYGTEVDVVGSYKITDNLTYTIGAGYLFTGDFYKGKSRDNEINDDFLVLNRLVFNF